MPPRSAAADHMLPCGGVADEPGGRINRMQRMRHRPREPGGGPTAGAPRPRTLPRGRLPRVRPRIRELEGRGSLGTAATAVIGIDVSKDTLDACLLTPDGKARDRAFPNGPAGFAALRAWAGAHAPGAAAHYGMESTGGYEDAIATHLHAAGRTVSVINPTRIKSAGVMRGRRNKTDKADARLIAAYTRDENPPAWSPPAPEVRELQAL